MREPTEAEIAAVISAMTSRAPAYDGPTNSLDRMTLLATGIAQAVLAAGHSDPVTAPGLDRAAVLAAAQGVLDGWHDGNRDRKAAEITDAIFALAATPRESLCISDAGRAKIAAAIEEADHRLAYSMELIKLVDGDHTYRLTIDGQTLLYADSDTADWNAQERLYAHIAAAKNRIRAEAVLLALASA